MPEINIHDPIPVRAVLESVHEVALHLLPYLAATDYNQRLTPARCQDVVGDAYLLAEAFVAARRDRRAGQAAEEDR